MIDRVFLFHCAYATVPQWVLSQGGGWSMVRLPIMGGIAEHRELGPILLDAPYGHEGPQNMGAMVGTLLQTLGLCFEDHWAVVPRLEEFGFRAADVGHVLMTHLHSDHTGAMKNFAHATFHLTDREWKHATDGSTGELLAQGYAPDDYRTLVKQVSPMDLVPHIGDGTAGHDLFGDGSVEVFGLSGHTPGQCGYRMRLSDGQRIFFLGDAAFSLSQIYGKVGLGRLPRTAAWSISEAEMTLQDLRHYAMEHPDDQLIINHDTKLGARCIDEGPIYFGAGATASLAAVIG